MYCTNWTDPELELFVSGNRSFAIKAEGVVKQPPSGVIVILTIDSGRGHLNIEMLMIFALICMLDMNCVHRNRFWGLILANLH